MCLICDVSSDNTAPEKRSSGGEPSATLSDLSGSVVEPQTSRIDCEVFNHIVERLHK